MNLTQQASQNADPPPHMSLDIQKIKEDASWNMCLLLVNAMKHTFTTGADRYKN